MARLFNARFVCVLFAFVLINASVSMAQTRRGVTPEDYFAFEFISDPNISPDGKLVAYVVTKIDRAQNRRNSSIWMVATDGSRAPWQFTTSPQSSNSPRWSPDGKSIAFLSSRPDANTSAASAGAAAEQPRNQIYVLSMDGGEAKRVTNLKNGVSVFRWSPDGSRLVVVSRIGPERQPHRRRTRAQRRASLQKHFLQIQRHGLVRRSSARIFGSSTSRVGQREADHRRQRLERHRSAMVARRHAHRVCF